MVSSTTPPPSTPTCRSIPNNLTRGHHPTAPLPLTVGVEIEHVLVLPRKNPFLSPLDYLHHQFQIADLCSSAEYDPKGVDHEYSTWLITTDSSIDLDVPAEVLQEKLHLVSRDGGVDVGEWECHGIELVSPPMKAPDVCSDTPTMQQGSLAIIKQYLDVLASKTSGGRLEHTAFATPSCGLHVHIGLPGSQAIPLPVLQQLAYLVLKYEDVLSTLHHHSRTPFPGTQASSYARSNRLSFLRSRHAPVCTVVGKDGFDLEQVRKRIFDQSMTTAKLAWMMGADDPLDDEGHPVLDDGSSVGLRKEDAAWVMPGQWVQEDATRDAGVVEANNVEGIIAAAWSDSEWRAEPSQSELSSWEEPDTYTERPWWEEAEFSADWQTPSEWHASNEQSPEHPDAASANGFSNTYLDDWFNPEILGFPEGEKYKITRWNLLGRHPCQGPRTIEFRQAAGSIDPNEIAETIWLYVALVRCAERAANAGGESSECCMDAQIDRAEPTLDDLLKLLQLPQSVRQYWTSRADKLIDEGFFALREPSTLKHWQKCNVCAVVHDHRIHTRLQRSQKTKGWQAFLKGNTKGRALWHRLSKHCGLQKDTWEVEREKLELSNGEAVAQPVKFSKRKCKGRKPTFTRKEKATAKTRARVQARRKAEEYRQKALSTTLLMEAASEYDAGWISISHASSEARSDEPWNPVSVGAPYEPVSGW